MWHPEVLPAGWTDAAGQLERLGLLDDAYLAGGTGLALHLGHRVSIDMDLMVPGPFSSSDVRDRLLGVSGLRRLELAPNTIHAELGGIKFSLLHYRYPLLFAAERLGHMRVADTRDIACMKVAAVANRGSRRDFVDLYAVATQIGLPALLDLFQRKYAGVAYNRIHVLKALTHFADAEDEPMPHMLVSIEWQAVRDYFEVEAPKLISLPNA